MAQKGFTLIELMIVVAIIGILAAIAIPEFSAYRIRAFNSASTNDLRNLMTCQEATFADIQSYSANGTTGTGPSIIANLIGSNVSKNVTFSVNTFSSGAAYTIYTGHIHGDKVLGGDYMGLFRFKNGTAGSIDATTESAQLSSSWGNGQL